MGELGKFQQQIMGRRPGLPIFGEYGREPRCWWLGVGSVSHELWKWVLKEQRAETQPQKLGFSHRTCVTEKD